MFGNLGANQHKPTTTPREKHETKYHHADAQPKQNIQDSSKQFTRTIDSMVSMEVP